MVNPIKIAGIMSTILIAEKDVERLRLLQKVLGSEHQLIIKRDSRQTARWLQTNCPDLIIVDLILDDINGIQLIKYIQNDLCYHVPIIVMATRGMNRIAKEAICEGASEYVFMPDECEDLPKLVKEWLRLKPNRGSKAS